MIAFLAAVVGAETMQVVTAVLALAAGALAIAVLGSWLMSGRVAGAAQALALVRQHRNLVTCLLAATAMAGSLYFSEVAHYVPCRLCWFQRVAMYPIALVALVGVLRGDRAARWYVLPFAGIGAVISGYHYLIEWKPGLDTGSCTLFGPSCTDVWFRTWGFATLAFMALCGFVAILVVNLVPSNSEAP